MSRRDNAHVRCQTCALHLILCLCSDVPELDLESKLCLVIHRDEIRKPTNTGTLAARCLLGSEVLVHGNIDEQTVAPWGQGSGISESNTLLLYPSEDVDVLTAHHLSNGPVRLVVPDGTWRQAAKMGRRIPWMRNIRRVGLPVGAVTSYRLRSEPKVGGLATMEAIARAFGVLEGQSVQEQLERVFKKMTDRTLYSRGLLARDEVFGGVPEGVERHNPAGSSS